MFSTLGGGGLGAVLGQAGDALSAPRRAVMGALGMPDSGARLLSETFDMDEGSALTQALGLGAEMAFDPLTYLGMGAGAPFMKWARAPWGAERALQGTAADMRLASGAAEAAMAERAALEAATLEQQLGRAGAINRQVSVPGVIDDVTKPYKLASNEAAAAFGQSNLGWPVEGGLEVIGSRLPPAARLRPVQNPATRRMMGSGVHMNPGEELPYLHPQELQFLQDEGRALGGGGAVANPQELVDRMLRRTAGGLNADRPMPMMGAAVNDPELAARLGPLAGMGVDAGGREAQSALLQALGELEKYKMTPGEYARIGAAGGTFGGLAGTPLFDRSERRA